jgi:hypothetical protein
MIEQASIFTVVLASFKIIEMLITKLLNKKDENGICKHNCNFNDDLRSKLNDIHKSSERQTRVCEMLEQKDGDGIPLAFYPRSYNDIQKDMKKSLDTICMNSKKQIDILQRIEKNFE